MAINREIKALTDYEHVRLRPTMYVGQIEQIESKVPIIGTDKENKTYIQKTPIIYSPAFYKLYDEVLGNAFDEAIRTGGKLKEIIIKFNSKTSEVTVIDTGSGFYKGTQINATTGKTNIETAFTMLKAGTNFEENIEDNLIGTNGVGVSLVNMLSEYFEVETTNDNFTYYQKWTKENWQENIISSPIITPKKRNKQKGTIIKFKPDIKLFKKNKWDKEYIYSLMLLKNLTKNEDPLLHKIIFKAFFDGKEYDLNKEFIPKDAIKIESKIGKLWIYRARENSMDYSFINGQLCEGTHQKIIKSFINDKIFDYQYAHWWYNTIIMLNLKPNLIQFADQNKTKFATGKWEIEPIMRRSFFNKLKSISKKDINFKYIQNKIDEYKKIHEIKELKRVRKKLKENTNALVSKYYPPSGIKETLFISEGLSASGGLVESRDTKTVGVYALRGKIKNTRKLSDLSSSTEIAQLLNILGLELDKKVCDYQNIIIAVDSDLDGNHISSLLVNLIHKWFQWLIDDGKLMLLITPVITAKINDKLTHFYSKDSFYKKNYKNVKDKTYIKGLGALNPEDWALIFENLRVMKFYNDRSAKRLLNIAFGKDASIRKKWLENKL